MDERTRAERRAKVVAEGTEAVITAVTQFTAGALGQHLGCRVDDVELEHLAARGTLEPVARYIWQVQDPARFREWVEAKLDQRERHREPPMARVPDPPPPDEALVLPLADAITRYLDGVAPEERDRVLLAAVGRVTNPPSVPVIDPAEREPA